MLLNKLPLEWDEAARRWRSAPLLVSRRGPADAIDMILGDLGTSDLDRIWVIAQASGVGKTKLAVDLVLEHGVVLFSRLSTRHVTALYGRYVAISLPWAALREVLTELEDLRSRLEMDESARALPAASELMRMDVRHVAAAALSEIRLLLAAYARAAADVCQAVEVRMGTPLTPPQAAYACMRSSWHSSGERFVRLHYQRLRLAARSTIRVATLGRSVWLSDTHLSEEMLYQSVSRLQCISRTPHRVCFIIDEISLARGMFPTLFLPRAATQPSADDGRIQAVQPRPSRAPDLFYGICAVADELTCFQRAAALLFGTQVSLQDFVTTEGSSPLRSAPFTVPALPLVRPPGDPRPGICAIRCLAHYFNIDVSDSRLVALAQKTCGRALWFFGRVFPTILTTMVNRAVQRKSELGPEATLELIVRVWELALPSSVDVHARAYSRDWLHDSRTAVGRITRQQLTQMLCLAALINGGVAEFLDPQVPRALTVAGILPLSDSTAQVARGVSCDGTGIPSHRTRDSLVGWRNRSAD